MLFEVQLLLLFLKLAQGYEILICPEDQGPITVEAKARYAFILQSNNYPSSMDKNCTLEIQNVTEDLVLNIQYVHAYYDGKRDFSFWPDMPNFTVDTSVGDLGFACYENAWLLKNKNCTIAHSAPLKDNFWKGFRAIFTFYPAHEPDCPAADSLPIAVDDFALVSYLRYPPDPASCAWNFLKPPVGFILAVKQFSNFKGVKITDESGQPSTYKSDARPNIESMDPEAWYLPEYFSSGVRVSLDTQKYLSSTVTVQILVTLIKEEKKECFLDFNGKLYTERSGRFSNLVPYSTYKKNQKCTWQLFVPKNATVCLNVSTSNVGWASEDWLGFSFSSADGYIASLAFEEAYCYHSVPFSPMIFTFFFETDGEYEYNGFDIKYTIEGGAAHRLGSFAVQIILLYILWLAQ